MEYLSKLTDGVLITIISTLAVGFLAYIYRTSILSYIKKLTYNGVDISGEWFQKQPYADSGENIEYEKTLSLKQAGYKLNGEWHFVKLHDGNRVAESKMVATGEILEGFVSLNFRSACKKSVSLGSMLLKISGDEATGSYIFRNINPNFSGDIASMNISLTRK